MTTHSPAIAAQPTARVLIVDGHAATRDGLALRLSRQPDLAVCAVTDNSAAAVELAATLVPEVVVTDIALIPDGPALIEKIRAVRPAARVLVWSLHSDPQNVERAFAAGAAGFVPNTVVPTVIRPTPSTIS